MAIKFKEVKKNDILLHKSTNTVWQVYGIVNFNAHLYIVDENRDIKRIGPENFDEFDMHITD